jgi:hypothetical protein
MPARTNGRGVLAIASLAAATALVVPACSLGGGDDEAPQSGDGQGEAVETGPDVDALRAAWAEAVGAACTERNEQIETLARDLPAAVEEKGLAAAAKQLAPVEETMLTTMTAAEPAPGDEERAREMAALYQEAGELRIQAVGTGYFRRDRRFYDLMERSEDAREQANAIATELGAERCAAEPPGPYATVDGFAAVRWGERESKVCRERDRVLMSLRPTDAAGFAAATRRWLRQTRALEPPEQYADRIERFIEMYEASVRAQDDAEAAYQRGDIAAGERLTDKGNRLTTKSTEVMYDIGFAIGFEQFCSAKPA